MKGNVMTNDFKANPNEFNALIDAACHRSGLDNRTIAQMAGLHSPNRLFMLRTGGAHNRVRLSEIPGLASALKLRAVDLLVLHLMDAAPDLYKAVTAEAGDRSCCQTQ